MAEGYLIGQNLLGDIRRTIAAVDGQELEQTPTRIQTRFEEVQYPQQPSRFFCLTSSLKNCKSATGFRVVMVSNGSDVGCGPRFEVDTQYADDVELFDISNVVRGYNVVSSRDVSSPLTAGRYVEAVRQRLKSGTFFWRVVCVVECDCDASSSQSGSSSGSYSASGSASDSPSYSASGSGSGSAIASSSASASLSASLSSASASTSTSASGSASTSGGSGSGSGGTIKVVTDVQCQYGSIIVTKTEINATAVG